MEAIALKANVTIDVVDVNTGRVRQIRRHNLVTLSGRNLIRDALNGTKFGIGVTDVAVGTNATAPAANQTGLLAEVNRGPISQRVLGDGSLTVQRFLTTADANGVTLKEAGLFAGPMLARVVFPDLAKTADLTVTITWTLTLSAAV